MARKKTAADFARMKREGEPIAWMTCYDYPTARLAEEAGLDLLLVGDSAGRVVWGYPSPHRITVDQMLVITEAVRRGAPDTFVVGDLPFLSYATPETALASAGRFYAEAGVDAVILEGGREIVPQVRAIAGNGMRVMGHLGLTPLSTARLESAEDVVRLVEDARALEEAGVFAILLGFSPVEAARALHARLGVPLLGGGSGPDTDGELQPVTDLIGTVPLMPPAMTTRYADLATPMRAAFRAYVDDVKSRRFPGARGIRLDPREAARLEELLPGDPGARGIP
jgi:3-methyl-2-oxobutanoate hydroxymethyltransferase